MAAPQKNILAKGSIVNDTYEVQFFIGRGAFGEVYRVKHKFLGTQVLKVLKQSYIENSDLKLVSSEARILAGLTHKNIVRIFETNTFELNGGRHFFMTMGFISGESLAQLLHRDINLPIAVSLSIEIAVLRALREVHGNSPPIIHRDISPDNVLLSYEDGNSRALLSDFGLAQSLEQMSGIAGAGGKYLYMAPECFWGVCLNASDIFSAGVVLYRMLTGLFPWNYDFDNEKDEDIETMVLRARKKRPTPPSKYNSACSESLDNIVLRSLNFDLETRYLSADEFLACLEAELAQTNLESNDSYALFH